jgi:hypothetical protein
MKAFVLLLLVLTVGCWADELSDFRKAVREHKAPVDHIATINGYEYEIYLHKGINKAIAMITSESMDRLFETPERFREEADAVQVYLHNLTRQPIVERTPRGPHPLPPVDPGVEIIKVPS